MAKKVKILTSDLGSNGQVGTIVKTWAGMIAVKWSDGSLGHYTLSKHQVEFLE